MTSSSSVCLNCQSSKTAFQCGICAGPICKSCTEFLEGDSFSYRTNLPQELTHKHYCFSCYSRDVQPALSEYGGMMAKARQVLVIDKPRRMPLPTVKTSKQMLTVKDCPDKEEALMRLAFHAVELGFNAIIKVEMEYKKIRISDYQTTLWNATGYPADLDPVRLERQNMAPG